MRSRFRLVVDDSAAFNQGAGIGRYARNLLPAALQHLSGVDVTLWYAPSRPHQPPFADATLRPFAERQPRVRRGPLSRRRMDQLWFRARLPVPMRWFVGRADLLYSPDFTVPPDFGTPKIVTVHDLAFAIRPEFTPGPLRHYLSSVVPRQVADAARVIAVSRTTARDLEERLGVNPARIAVVPNGVEERFFAAAPLSEDVRQQMGLPRDYLLTVGTLEPRKNHLGLLAALASRLEGIDLPLVIAGRKGWDFEPILRAAAPLQARGQVVMLDYVPDELMPGLYAGAAAVVYPSWYEGFGLPVLEALAAGVPVVAGDVPALREVGDDAAIYADPSSIEAIAMGIRRALDSEQSTPEARSRRQERARQSLWSDAGGMLANVFADVTGRPDLLRTDEPR